MTAIHETAYPRLRNDWTEKLLTELFTPKEEEISFASCHTRQPLALMSILVQLKTFQYLGRFVPFNQISKPIIDHVAQFLNVDLGLTVSIVHQQKQLKFRYVKLIREFMGITSFDIKSKNDLKRLALQAAQTKNYS